MAKDKNIIFLCTHCGNDFSRWHGQCPDCGEWDTLKENRLPPPAAKGRHGYAGERSEVKTMAQVETNSSPRFTTELAEFDRVLGGGRSPRLGGPARRRSRHRQIDHHPAGLL